MRRSRYEPPRPPDPSLDPYRRGIATVWDGSDQIGYLATRVQTWWRTTGPWWSRQRVDPVERAEWLLSFTGSDTHGGYVDGVALEVAARVDGWNRDHLRYGGKAYRLRWLHGPDADQAWATPTAGTERLLLHHNEPCAAEERVRSAKVWTWYG